MKPLIKWNDRGLAALTVVVFLLQFLAPARVWTLLFVSLALFQGIGWLWARQLAAHFKFTRERRYNWAQVGDRLEERFTISNVNAAGLPTQWLKIDDGSTLPGETTQYITALGSQQKLSWRSERICSRRGVFQLGPTQIEMSDPFGLFDVRQQYPNKIDFTIVPPILPFTALQVAVHGEAGDHFLRRFSRVTAPVVRSVRAYQPGDSLRRIHWPTTARRGELFVRNLELSAAGDWWLVLDMAANTNPQGDRALEKGVLIASSLADRGLTAERAVGLVAYGQNVVWLPPQRAGVQRWRILYTLAQLNAGQRSLADLLNRNRQNIGRQSSLIIITAGTQFDWLAPLSFLLQRHITPTVVLIYSPHTLARMTQIYETLVDRGITTYLVDDIIEPPDLRESGGAWVWRVTGFGKAVAVHRPQGDWQQL